MNMTMYHGRWALATVLALTAGTTAPALGQAGGSGGDVPLVSTTVFAGYGTANYGGTLSDAYAHDFSVSLSPILLFGLGPDILFEAEFEFELSGAETETAIEYAQIDYLRFDRVQFSVGKFLLPFGVFGERVHPSWINKLPTMPSVYGHAHGGVAENALLPILADVGAMARVNLPAWGTTSLNLSFYVTQGPEQLDPSGELVGEDDHSHAMITRLEARTADPEHEDGGPSSSVADLVIPGVAFGTNTSDNNQNKMLGARLGLVRGAGLEVYLSGFHAMYDEDDYLDYTGGALSVELRRGPWDVKGEGVLLNQEFVRPAIGEYATLRQRGYYVQGSRRLGIWEPVLRWSQLLDGEVGDEVVRAGRHELMLGLNYWVSPSVPLKLAYGWNDELDDRILLQWAFGF